MLNQVNSKKQGDVGVGIAIGYFASKGFTVCLPLTDSQDYDLVIDNGTLEKVQVKTSRKKTKYGNYEVDLRTSGGNKSGTGKTKKLNPEKIDSLFIVTGDGRKYFIPVSVFDGEVGCIRVGIKYTEYEVFIG